MVIKGYPTANLSPNSHLKNKVNVIITKTLDGNAFCCESFLARSGIIQLVFNSDHISKAGLLAFQDNANIC